MSAKLPRAATVSKPSKPTKDWPLWWHPEGGWSKKIRGKVHYFGRDDDVALQRWNQEKEDLLAGRTPKARTEGGKAVFDLCEKFLAVKSELVVSGELTKRSYLDYDRTCTLVGDEFGDATLLSDLAPDDFDRLRAKMARRWGPSTVAGEITRIRVLFKFAYDSYLLDAPIRYGAAFRKPSRKVMRRVRGPRLFAARQIRRLAKCANPQMRAMILLGINAALGPSDLGQLPRRAVDLPRGWLHFARPKTEIDRRVPLWPITVQAIRAWLKVRPRAHTPADDRLLFVTGFGQRWHCDNKASPLSREFKKLLDAVGIEGLGFYDLRRTHRTVSDEAGDQPAAMYLMGHAADDGDMSSVYRQSISDERLRKVADRVHRWLLRCEPARWAEKYL